MLDFLRNRLLVPVPEDDRDRALVIRVFNCVSLSIMACISVGAIGTVLVFQRKAACLAMVVVVSLVLAAAIWIARHGRIRHASVMSVLCLWLAFTVNIWLSGTVNTILAGMYIAIIAIAGVLAGRLFAVIVALASLVSAFGLSLLQSLGYAWPSYYPMPPWAAWFVLLFTIVLVLSAIDGVVEAFSEASHQAALEIEARRSTEQVLRANEARYRSLFDQIGDAVAVYKAVNDGEDFIFADFNKAGEQIEHIPREALIGRSVREMFPGVEEFGLLEVFREVWRTGKAQRHPVTLYSDQRVSGWRENFVYRLPSGEIVAVYSDETERKRAEEELRRSEAKYRFLAQHASDLIWILDLDLRTTFVTPSVKRVLGFTPDERMLQKVEEQLTPESLDKARRMLLDELILERDHGITEGKSVLVELDYYHKNGSIVCLQTGVTFIRDEKGIPIGLHGISRDVTDLKRAQEALRQSEEKYRTVVEEAFDGVFVQDGTLIKFANSRLHEMLGYEPGELEGLDHWIIYHPDYREITRGRAQARLRGESALPRYEVSLLRKDGTSFPGEVSTKVIALDGVPQIQVWIRDLTEQKLLERELIEVRKTESMGTLTGGIAHDFNNLFTVINGYAEMVLMDTASRDPRYGDLKTVLETGRKGAELVRRLLALSKKGESNPALLDLNLILKGLSGLIKRTFPKAIDIETILDRDLRMIRADAAQVEQALMNLFINAREAMPDGGKLTIATSNENLQEEDWRLRSSGGTGPHVLVEVTDTGAGMDAETLGRIFDPFFTTKGWDSRKGTGLSLPVAKGIIEQHKGRITCDSVPGKGTTFRVYFPAVEEVPASDTYEVETASIVGSETVLLVDDEENVLDLGTKVLRSAGYSVFTAANGREALEIYSRDPSSINVVVLDLIMPQMGGEKCLEELHRLDPQVKAIVSTGHSLLPEERERLSQYAKGFVQKPYQIRRLPEVIREVLECSGQGLRPDLMDAKDGP